MKQWVRRIRAAVGMGLVWGAAWFGAGLVMLVASGFEADVPFPLLFALLGFIAGILFSALLGVRGKWRRLDQLSIARFAGWGATGGLLLAGMFAVVLALSGENAWGDLVVVGPVLAAAGAISAAGSLALARRAGGRELPHPCADASESELDDGVTQVLPGGVRVLVRDSHGNRDR